MNRHFPLLIALIAFTSLQGAEIPKWERFRGPNGSGVDASRELPVKWAESNFEWKTKIPGQGHGSPVIWGDHIFLLSAVADQVSEENGSKNRKKKKGQPALPYQWVAIAVSRNSGEIVWQKKFPARKFKGHRFNSPASSTAAVNAERVVFSWGTADQLTLVSLSHEGELHWQKDMGPVSGGHGFGASPILYKDLVILNNDQEKGAGNLFALRAENGELVWTVPRKSQRISYSVPCIYQENLVFVNWQHGFTAIQPETGAVIDDKSVFNLDTNERAISSPVVVGETVIGTCGFTANPKHCVAMRLMENKWQEIWRIEKNVPHIPSVVAVGDRVFLWDDAGIASCIEAASGKQVWKERLPNIEGTCFGSPVSDGKHIFCADVSGNIHVIAASENFSYLATNPLGESCKTTPAIADGKMYIRTETTLHAVSPGT
ncbi:MAG: PQQ-binding-like beta-propeller repeat protein [Verrucomicrobiales bacterium]|nr:PQQ-binding-like beta-propeller repeat protein [Verrucomicrobiales bacterium]